MSIPHTLVPESTIPLLLQGYSFISKRCDRLHSDIFQTRIMLQKTICMRGANASQLFYDQDRFQRQGGAPERLQKSLFGVGGVQGLDDQAHEHRKGMFMSLMTPEAIGDLSGRTHDQLVSALAKWQKKDQVVLFDALHEVLCRAVCSWSGVPLDDHEAGRRAADLGAMIEASGGLGPRYWKGRIARKRSEQWIGKLIDDVRSGTVSPPPGSALQAISLHRDLNGRLLETRVAAVELINILRPTVAVSRYIIFAALALHQHPQWRRKTEDSETSLELFVQEVRRLYPFFPFIAARVRKTFEWNGYRFPEGVRVLLDVYGTNRDPLTWDHPETFDPERFRNKDINPFTLIPQGGGDHYQNHRCAGEWITIDLMKTAVRFLVTSMDYQVPHQDLTLRLSRMPAIPKSRFVITARD